MTVALALAGRGYAVFPCRVDKRPATPHGFKDAQKDQDAVTELWSRHPGPLIGIVTGTASGIDVLDIDAKHDEALAWWHCNRARIPATWRYRTRSGGLHVWFWHWHGQGCTAGRIARGIDTRGDGGYVIYWPGAGLPVLGPSPLAPWPEWLIQALRPKLPSESAVRPRRGHLAAPEISGVLRVAATALEGGRNRALFWTACRLAERVQSNFMKLEEAEALLLGAAASAGLPEREARATIASAWRTVAQ